jgi:hypothetical protein
MRAFISTIILLCFTHLNLAQADSHNSHLVFKNGALHAHLNWLTGPFVEKESVLQIHWMNPANHQPTALDGTFTVTLFMPEMGHGSSPTTITASTDEKGLPRLGVYNISQMYFLMTGQWQVNINVKYTDGSEETQTLNVTVE